MARRNHGNSGSGEKKRGGARRGALALVIDPDAHRALDAHCGANPRNEVCGVLVGFTGEDDGRRWTRVVAIIEGKHAREEQMSVTFTHETWDAVHDALAKRTDKARVVGWYHTHPDFGVFYSAPDVFVHRNFFNLEGQVGIVVDPVRDERGVFASTAQGIVTLARYEVARQNARGHLVDCRYADDPLRDDMPEARAAASTGDAGLMRSNLDSIEARIAELGQRMNKLATMLLVVAPVMGALGFGAGLYFGRGGSAPHQFVVIDGRGQPTGEVVVSLEWLEAAKRAEEKRLRDEAAKAKAKLKADEEARTKSAPGGAPAVAPAPPPATSPTTTPPPATTQAPATPAAPSPSGGAK